MTEGQKNAPDLEKRLVAVTSKRSSLTVGIVGEAGIGKTHRVNALLRGLGCQHAVVAARSGAAGWARSVPRSNRTPDWAQRALAQLELRQPMEAKAVADALGAVLVALAPFVLVLEDAHEANPETAAVIAHLARIVGRSRGVGLIITASQLEPALDGVLETVTLDGLGETALRELLETEVNGTLPPEVLAWIGARSGGNPLFALEYLRFLRRSGQLWSDAQRWRWREPGTELVPVSIEALVARSLENVRNDPELEAALRARAMLPDADLGRWSRVSGLAGPRLEKATIHLEREGVLVSGEFTRPIVASVILASLTPSERRRLSQDAVHALRDDAPEFAAALVEGAQLEPSVSVPVLEKGARAALEAGRTAAAARFMAQASELADAPDRARLTLEAARLFKASDPTEALRLASLAAALDPSEDAIFLQAELLARTGREIEAARRAESFGPHARERWLETLIETRYDADDDAGVIEIWNANPALHGHASVRLRVRVGYALAQVGRFEDARAVFKSTLDADLSPSERAWCESAAATVELDAGELERAEHGFSKALNAFDALEPNLQRDPEFRKRRAAALRNRSTARYRLGRFTDAMHDLEGALSVHAEAGEGQSHAEAQVSLGMCLIATAEFERAEDAFTEARAVLERGENLRALSLADQGLTQLYLEWSPPHASVLALRHAQAAEREARGALIPPNLAQALHYAAWAEAVHGRPERALELSDESARLSQQLELGTLLVLADWTRGLALERLGQRDAALKAIDRAAQDIHALGYAGYAARLALEADRLRDDATSARAHLEGIETLGHQGWMHVAHKFFPALAQVALAAPALSGAAPARLELLGELRLLGPDGPQQAPAEQGRALLVLLLEARATGREGVRVLDLLDALYPDADEAKAQGALKQLVYRLRGALGKRAIVRLSDAYALGEISSDAEDFLFTHDTQLWRGPCLGDLGIEVGVTLRETLYESLRGRAETLVDQDPLEAARLASILTEADPYDRLAFEIGARALTNARETARLERWVRNANANLSEVGEALSLR
jgi:tetratricopeptide (TPR) repeat protein